MITATGVTNLLWLSDLYSLNYLLDFYFPYALMQTFPEGFITGTVLSLLVIYQLEWVATFRDEFYLHHKHPGDAHRPKKEVSHE